MNKIIAGVVLILTILLVIVLVKIANMNSDFNESDVNLKNNTQTNVMLQIIYDRIFIFKNYLIANIDEYPEYREYILQFNRRIQNLKIYENIPNQKTTSYTINTGENISNKKTTSYTINKGEKIALCLRSQTGKIHDINIIMYVVIHELAHVACPEWDYNPDDEHTPLFTKIFIFFLRIAVKINIYVETNYQINPHEYCGLIINEHLL